MAGYSITPLVKKLGVKPGHSVCLLNAPDNYFDLISPLPDSVTVKNSLRGAYDLIHLFAVNIADFKKTMDQAKKHLRDNGIIWVSWPKKKSKVLTELDENKIRDYGLQLGLVDVKVCAVDSVWSGLKFVIPLKDRR